MHTHKKVKKGLLHFSLRDYHITIYFYWQRAQISQICKTDSEKENISGLKESRSMVAWNV